MADVVQQGGGDQVVGSTRGLRQRPGLQHVLGHGDRLAEVLPGAFAVEQLLDGVQCGHPPAQQGEGAGERVEVGVAALEVAAAVLLEGGPGVQQADVVEDQAVAGPEPEVQLQFRAEGDRGEPPVRGVEGVQFGGRQAAQRTDRAVVEPHLADAPDGVHADQRLLRAQLGGPVAEDERHGRAGQHGEVLGRLLPQQRRRVEAVHQAGVAALGVVAQAVQQLERRHRVAVRVVGVRRDRGAGERKVVRVLLDPDVEQQAVVGLADVPEGLRDLEHLPLGLGHTAQHREPEASNRAQHRDLLGGFRHVRGPRGFGESTREVGGPPEPLALLRPPVALFPVLPPVRLAEPLQRVPRAVAVRPEHLQVPVRLGALGHGQVLGQVGDLEQLLSVARVAAPVARAVVTQPVRGKGHR